MAVPRVMVTGGLGFVGSAVLDSMLEMHPEWSISVFDLRQPETPEDNVEYIIGDIMKPEDVKKALFKMRPDCVVHTAGIVPDLANRHIRVQRRRIFEINVEGTRSMLDVCERAGVKAFVWTSSHCCVIDDTRSPYPNIDETWPTSNQSLIYGESKAAAEALVLSANHEKFLTCSIRPSVLCGRNDNQLVPPVHACISTGETPFVVGTAENLWDVTFVPNVGDAHVLAVQNLLTTATAAGEAIFISNMEPITFRDFCLAVWREFGHIPPYEIHIPEGIAWVAGYFAEWVTWLRGRPTTFSRGGVLDACAVRYTDGVKAKKLLGYVPRIGIEEGIKLSCKDLAERLARAESQEAEKDLIKKPT